MKKIIAKIIHKFNSNYFTQKSYAKLEWWGVEDVINDELIF